MGEVDQARRGCVSRRGEGGRAERKWTKVN
jgi:hypothetical protein